MDVFFNEVDKAKGANRTLDNFVLKLKNELTDLNDIEFRARNIVDHLALAMQGSLLVRNGNSIISDLFCASRLNDNGRHNYGTMPKGGNCTSIIQRARPQVP